MSQDQKLGKKYISQNNIHQQCHYQILTTTFLAWTRYKEYKLTTVQKSYECTCHYLETNGQVIGYTAMESYIHVKDKLLLPRDISCKITKTKADLKVSYYNLDAIVQVYYKKIWLGPSRTNTSSTKWT